MTQAQAQSPKLPLHPRYWIYWLAAGILWTLALLPLRLQYALGLGLGDLLHRLSKQRRRIAQVNVDLCFPDLSEAARARMVRQHFHSLGLALFEVALSWWGSDRRLKKMARVEGLEHLEAAIAQGKGALLVSAHFTQLELIGRLLAMFHPIAAVYRPNDNPVIEYLFIRNRNRMNVQAIRKDNVKGVLRSLKNNLPVWYAQDQSSGVPNSVIVPFFGNPAATYTSTHRFARISGASVLFFFGIREGCGRYRLVIRPPLLDFPSDDATVDTARINGLIEEAVRLAPEQYLWTHRRFKNRPGIPNPY